MVGRHTHTKQNQSISHEPGTTAQTRGVSQKGSGGSNRASRRRLKSLWMAVLRWQLVTKLRFRSGMGSSLKVSGFCPLVTGGGGGLQGGDNQELRLMADFR